MKLMKCALLLSIVLLLNSCASGYKTVNPGALNYTSSDARSGVILEYKYHSLNGKYDKKAAKKGIKLIAVKVTNTTETDLVFGRDIVLTYENDTALPIMETEQVFTSLKQSVPSYLWYLLLSPIVVGTQNNNGTIDDPFPIGLILGPGIAGGNMIAAGSANTNFKKQLVKYTIFGTVVEKGKSIHGLVGVRSDNFKAIQIQLKQNNDE